MSSRDGAECLTLSTLLERQLARGGQLLNGGPTGAGTPPNICFYTLEGAELASRPEQIYPGGAFRGEIQTVGTSIGTFSSAPNVELIAQLPRS